jgi:hypothetical protein
VKLIKNELQKQNLAKFLYDIAKIIFGVVVVAQIVKPEEFKALIFVSGVAARPLQNAPFCPISALGSNFNPQNTQCIPVVKIFACLALEQN